MGMTPWDLLCAVACRASATWTCGVRRCACPRACPVCRDRPCVCSRVLRSHLQGPHDPPGMHTCGHEGKPSLQRGGPLCGASRQRGALVKVSHG